MELIPDTLLSFAYYGSIAIIVAAESVAEFRPSRRPVIARWPRNVFLGAIGIILEKSLLVLSGASVILFAENRDWGLMAALDLPGPVVLVLSILALDLLFYFVHRLFHAVPLFWRIHRVHHSDTDFDFSVGLRRHPLETLSTMLIAFPVIILLGVPLAALLLFQLMRSPILFFEHANIALPDKLDRLLRLFVVTPNMHRIHHSAWKVETDSNFSDLFPVWDRLFGTYRAYSREPQQTMRVGLEYFRSAQDAKLSRVLLQPFLK